MLPPPGPRSLPPPLIHPPRLQLERDGSQPRRSSSPPRTSIPAAKIEPNVGQATRRRPSSSKIKGSIPELHLSDGWEKKHTLFVKWKYAEASRV